MPILHFFTCLLFTALLSGCSANGPTASALDPKMRGGVKIEGVQVNYMEMGASTDGRKVGVSKVEKIFDQESERLVGLGDGMGMVTLYIAITSIRIIDGPQSVLLGGESIMKGNVTVSDKDTGHIILPATEIEAGGGGWVLGGFVGAMTMDDPATELRQMSEEFVDRIQVLILGV